MARLVAERLVEHLERFAIILRDAVAALILEAEIALRGGIALVRLFAEPFDGLALDREHTL